MFAIPQSDEIHPTKRKKPKPSHIGKKRSPQKERKTPRPTESTDIKKFFIKMSRYNSRISISLSIIAEKPGKRTIPTFSQFILWISRGYPQNFVDNITIFMKNIFYRDLNLFLRDISYPNETIPKSSGDMNLSYRDIYPITARPYILKRDISFQYFQGIPPHPSFPILSYINYINSLL